MRIKRIEIIGFKSFNDKAVLAIHQPVTAVVGPNGCGKSNIVDAIRWCMGEQSAKHLRGKAMEDVIFAGSESRGGAGMAEVSLTFENAGLAHSVTAEVAMEEDLPPELGEPGEDLAAGDLALGSPEDSAEAALGDDPPPIDYTQYGELTVTRRLFRDGTSEYFINKTPCRLRDITDFFLGTGVGTKAYSIIEQGRIGLIVSSKPEDRRLIIEEAAGITKFKKKKQAAERKIEQTRQNLVRVSDIVSEIDKRLGSLRRQAQKAERYKKYRAEVRDIEMWIATHRYLGFAAKEQLFLGHRAELVDQRDAARVDHEVREAQIAAERAESTLEERRLSELTQTVFELENRLKLGESQVEFQRREAHDLEARVLLVAGELEGLRRQVEETDEELARIREAATRLDLEADVRARELLGLEEAQVVARSTLADAQADLDAARSEVGRAQAQIARAENNQRSLDRRRGDLELRLGRVEEEEGRSGARADELGTQMGPLDEKLFGLRQLSLDLSQQKESMERRRTELQGHVRTYEAEVETLRTELHRRRSRLQSLREIQDRYEGFARGTRAVMQHRPGDDAEGKRIRGVVADIVQAPAEYEMAIEAVLGDRLGSVLVESQAVGAEAISFLKQRAEGRSTFIPVTEFTHSARAGGAIEVVEAEGVRGPILGLIQVSEKAEEYRPIADYLFGDVLVVESLPRALELFAAGVRRTLVTLDGDVVDPRGAVTGGSRADGAGVLSQKREIRELDEICAALDQDLANATARHVAAKAELSQVGSTLDAIRKDSHQGEITILSCEKDLLRYRAEAERLGERRAQLERERSEMQAGLNEVHREAEENTVALLAGRQAADDAERRQLGLIEGVTVARGAVDDASQAVTECKVRVAQVGSERASIRAHVDRLEKQAREQDSRQSKLERSREEDAARATSLRDEAGLVAETLVGIASDRREQAQALAMGKSGYEARMATLMVAEVEARNVRLAFERLAQEAQRLEMELRDLDTERRHVMESIAERYRQDLLLELHAYHLRKTVSEADEARLKELRELIERMGEINLTAIEEFEELQTRYDFLTAQKTDLESALDQLERAIAKINKTSRRLFRDTFNAVNAKFQEVFPRLFRGGHAELRLVGGDEDLLDAGVEILARPPGKKNQTVDLLSGGEKALTAVSLIFAIFLIKPSPFCLLDEVDAPLDEANVDRYNELVRELTDRSQFIVITHNKRTMEMADSLYGVTMEEPGCSKLVSVNLRTFQKIPAKAA